MPSKKFYHVPQGDPCTQCGNPARRHVVEHAQDGDPCRTCGVAGAKHKSRTKKPQQYHAPQGNPCRACGLAPYLHVVEHAQEGDPCRTCGVGGAVHKVRGHRTRDRSERLRYSRKDVVYIGIDGEGQGRKDHRYVMMGASTESGAGTWSVHAERLSTKQCLDFILSLPRKNTRIFAYSFNYDLTKMLEDVDNETLYALFRPELRPSDDNKGPKPVYWNGYLLNLQGTKFTVQKRGGHRVVIWDLFKFFQAKFVSALKDWKVGSHSMLERMTMMKDKRAEFDKEKLQDVEAYCLEECKCIAELAHKLTDAHLSAGLRLKNYYGAGSSAKAMLGVMGIREQIVAAPEPMKEAVASAFFGGRFENSVIGQFEEELYNWDISSAYPYQTTFLPCLKHGQWEKTKSMRRMRDAEHALVHYRLGVDCRYKHWGPFPFRTEDGSISFPINGGEGWVWRDEFLAGERMFPHVEFLEAWTYHRECGCQPFKRIPEYYKERIKLGKEGPGIVIKLGVNACYGSLAQSVGSAIFNSWIWAGMITSGCRAQILDLLALHTDRSNLLMVATDGIYTREKLTPPIPRDTGTFETGKPLGGWEGKVAKKGVFVARPGIYFPLHPTKEELKEIRGRGVGKGVVLENWQTIIDAWHKDGVNGTARVANVTRFCGAKTSISYSPSRGLYTRAASGNGKAPHYGQWITRRVELSFNPMPKRECVNRDGKTLKLREFPYAMASTPYNKAMRSRESYELAAAAQELIEQPDVDYTDYEVEDGET